MPTTIPIPPKRSWTVAAVATLMHSLAAMATIGLSEFIIVWAYR